MVMMAAVFCLERGREIIFFIRYTAIYVQYVFYEETGHKIDEKIILVQKCEKNEPANDDVHILRFTGF